MNYFEKWLSNRGLLDIFKTRCIETRRWNTHQLKLFLKTLNSNMIDRGLTWNATSEGHEFWNNVDTEWRNCLNKNML